MIGLFSKVRTGDAIYSEYTSMCCVPLWGGVSSFTLATLATAQAVRYTAQAIFHWISSEEDRMSEEKGWAKGYAVTAGFHAANALTLGLFFCVWFLSDLISSPGCGGGYESD